MVKKRLGREEAMTYGKLRRFMRNPTVKRYRKGIVGRKHNMQQHVKEYGRPGGPRQHEMESIGSSYRVNDKWVSEGRSKVKRKIKTKKVLRAVGRIIKVAAHFVNGKRRKGYSYRR